jgi:hypothetical protein
MVVMFVECCVGGGWYFLYYFYHRNPTGQEFFVPTGTLIAVNLFKELTIYNIVRIVIQEYAAFSKNELLNIRLLNTDFAKMIPKLQ